MACEKHNWQTGQVITADKLNNIQDGIGEDRGVYKVNLTLQGDGSGENPYYYETDKTWQEIADTFNAGQKCLINYAIKKSTPRGQYLNNCQSIIYTVCVQTSLNGDPYMYMMFFNSSEIKDIEQDYYGIVWHQTTCLTASSNNDTCRLSIINASVLQ